MYEASKSSTRNPKADPASYIAARIGQPWERSGVHCWKLVRQTLRDLFDVRLPLIARTVPTRRVAEIVATHPERVNWDASDIRSPWALALMARKGSSPEDIEHIGVYFLDIDGGGVFHSDAPHGVVFDSLFHLVRIRSWQSPTLMVPRKKSPHR